MSVTKFAHLLNSLLTIVVYRTVSASSTLEEVQDHRIALSQENGTSTDTQTLLAFKQSLQDPRGELSNWNSTDTDACGWKGVTCFTGRVTALNLTQLGLNGSISDILGNLQSLESLDLTHNSFRGEIPSAFQNCSQLLYLFLSFNELTGPIPPEIGQITSLKGLRLSNNSLTGKLPTPLGSLQALQQLDLSNNLLNGSFDAMLWNLSSLRYLSLSNNKFEGTIPSEIRLLTKLQVLRLDGNQYTGEIPSDVGQLASLEELSLNNNNISGQISEWFGNLSSLSLLELQDNRLHGTIPSVLGRLNNLWRISLSKNDLEGLFPSSIANCSTLNYIDFEFNHLTGGIPQDVGRLSNLIFLALSGNQMSGELPSALGNCSKLVAISLSSNNFFNPIPTSFAQLSDLQRVYFGGNKFTGVFPVALLNCTQLGDLDLSGNQFSGEIPSEIGQLLKLEELHLNNNNFTGRIPSSIGYCRSLVTIILSNNKLSGDLPGLAISNFTSLGGTLDLSMNMLSGSIPEDIERLMYVQKLNFSMNNFSGVIPTALSSCFQLTSLDLSYNNLTGEIPMSLTALSNLEFFNVSYNNLQGEIPDTGVFSEFRAASFLGNPGLCGSVVNESCKSSAYAPSPNYVHHDSCSGFLKCRGIWPYIVFALGLLVSLAAFCLGEFFCFCIISARNMDRTDGEKDDQDQKSTPKPRRTYLGQLNYSGKDIQAATNEFSEDNIVGHGSSSIIYQGIFGKAGIAAIKKVDWTNDENARKGLLLELQMLTKLRHRNLLSIRGFCFNTEMTALVLEIMPNGSLEKQLYGRETCQLSWYLRLNIAIGVAHGMVYLHHECLEPIIHCDLKPSNILLGTDFEAKVSDFGISRYIHDSNTGEATMTTLFGTRGYIPPEYAMASKVSTKGDVYSYGVILLELLTRIQPSDDNLPEGVSLVEWVRSKYSHTWMKTLDPTLSTNSLEKNNVDHSKMHLTMRVALLCTQDAPNSRPSFRDVLEMLTQIQDHGTCNRWKVEEEPKSGELVSNSSQ